MSTLERPAETLARDGSDSPERSRRVAGVVCAVPIALFAVLAWRHRWVTDDAFIDLRIVDNIHHGLGPVYNAGERVEVFTSPAWVASLWGTSAVLRPVALEWLAVLLGLVTSLGGIAAAGRGSWLVWRRVQPQGAAVPLGVVVLVALPPMWDFATSGLETGMVFAWLGVCFWRLAALLTQPLDSTPRTGVRRLLPRWTPTTIGLLIGIGPLVRPDLAIFSAGFLMVLLVAPRAEKRAARLRLVAWTLLVPLAYQLFRMGYYAALEPNTALAKEAGSADWGRGWAYLKDFVRPYYLFVPVAVLLGFAAFQLRPLRKSSRALTVLVVAPPACAAIHALYIVRVGGDFMHARMLLPSLFAAMLPVAVVSLKLSPRHLAVGIGVGVWAILCLFSFRTPYADPLHPKVIGDERAFYVALAGNANPVTLADFKGTVWAQNGAALRRHSEKGPALIAEVPKFTRLGGTNGAPNDAADAPVVAGAAAIGILGYAAGPRVYIADQLGLADPLGSRTRLEALRFPGGLSKPARPRPGHDKFLPREWIAARFSAPGPLAAPKDQPLSPEWVAAARRALACDPLRRVLAAVDEPLTLSRFVSNVGDSFSFTRLRFSPDPARAARELCGSG
jgi:arabinofuranosyltransferase